MPPPSGYPDTTNTAALIEAVKRVALVAERNTPVRLEFEGSELTLRAGAGEDAQAVDVLESSLEGDAIDIAFNPAYLLDGLAAVGSAVTRFSFTQQSRPAVLTAVGDDGQATDDYKYLLMPVRLTG